MEWITNKIKAYIQWGWIAISTIIGGFLFIRNVQLKRSNKNLQKENNNLHLKNKTTKTQTHIDDKYTEAQATYKLEPMENPNEIVTIDA